MTVKAASISVSIDARENKIAQSRHLRCSSCPYPIRKDCRGHDCEINRVSPQTLWIYQYSVLQEARRTTTTASRLKYATSRFVDLFPGIRLRVELLVTVRVDRIICTKIRTPLQEYQPRRLGFMYQHLRQINDFLWECLNLKAGLAGVFQTDNTPCTQEYTHNQLESE